MTYITGDTHGYPRRLKAISAYDDADAIIVCGDFGFLFDGSKEEERTLEELNRRGVPILFLDGNHENYDLLKQYPVTEWNGGKIQFIRENIIHLMRGQVYTINGYKIFVMGGAECHDIEDGIIDPDDPHAITKIRHLQEGDKRFRIKHVSWWPEELPLEEELAEGLRNLAAHNYEVDAILTHCAPTSLQIALGKTDYPINRLTDYLETIKQTIRYRIWCFGHYHSSKEVDEKHFVLHHGAIQLEQALPK